MKTIFTTLLGLLSLCTWATGEDAFSCYNLSNITCGQSITAHMSSGYGDYDSKHYGRYAGSYDYQGKDKVYRIRKTSSSGPLTIHLSTEISGLNIFLSKTCDKDKLEIIHSGSSMKEGKYIHTTEGLPAGTYYIIVDAGRHTMSGDYTLTVNCETMKCSHAQRISCGTTLNDVSNAKGRNAVAVYACGRSQKRNYTGKELVFEFDVAHYDEITIELSDIARGLDFDMFLFDEECPRKANCIASSTNGGYRDERIKQKLYPGKYYLVVDTWEGEVGTFDLSISGCSTKKPNTKSCHRAQEISCDAHLRNESNEYADNYNESYDCSGGSSKKYDGNERIYKLEVGKSQSVQIELQDIKGYGVNFDLFLLKNDCSDHCVFSSTRSGKSDEIINARLLGGTYYIVVDTWKGETGSYTLKVSACDKPEKPSTPTASVSSCSRAAKLHCGEYAEGNITGGRSYFDGDDYDCSGNYSAYRGADHIYKITKEHRSHKMQFHLYTESDDLNMFLVRGCSNGELQCLARGKDFGRGKYIDEGYKNYEAGEYYIIVDGHSSNTQGKYRLEASCGNLPFTQAKQLTCAHPFKGERLQSGTKNRSVYQCNRSEVTGLSGYERVYYFDVDEAQLDVELSVSHISPGADVELMLFSGFNGSDGCYELGKSTSGFNKTITKTLSQGRYYAVVDSRNSNGGTYQISLKGCTCSSDGEVFCGEPLRGNNTGGGNDIQIVGANCANKPFHPSAEDVIYEFTAPETQEYSVRLYGMEKSLSLFVLRDCQDPNSCIAFSTRNGSQHATFDLVKGEQVYFVVDALARLVKSNFTLLVQCSEEDFDLDFDGIVDGEDNCPEVANAGQEDYDNDGMGDSCDDDDDNDGVIDELDCQPRNESISLKPGDACDDNDPATINDVINEQCTCVGSSDQDEDGITDSLDNCITIPNPDQADYDNDGMGDSCDEDDDNDGVIDSLDCMPRDSTVQLMRGDRCDDGNPETSMDIIDDNCNCVGGNDRDMDGIPDLVDNCPDVANNSQLDTDNDGQGDACEVDRDGDGVPDDIDCDPDDPDVVLTRGAICNDGDSNTVNDRVGQDCVCRGSVDSDFDGIADNQDNCPMVANEDQIDFDGDGFGNACDMDDDNDGVADDIDCFPLDSIRSFQRGMVCNDGDSTTVFDRINEDCICEGQRDLDNDGIADGDDNCPAVGNPDQEDFDGDGFGDLCDDDDDNDGVLDSIDCNSMDSTINFGIGMPCDDNDPTTINDVITSDCQCNGIMDRDGDGVLDEEDNCPMTANENQADNDQDGIGDVCDDDDDNDGLADELDCAPNDSTIVFTIGDICDDGNEATAMDTINENCECVGAMDIDRDGIPNAEDNCMAIANPDQADNDGDGAGDVCDEDDDNDGVLDSIDCDPLDADFNFAIGSACDDGDSTTINDQYNENCQCVGDQDSDGDGILDSEDNCPSIVNADQQDQDGDGLGNLCDEDDDNDGVLDSIDCDPLDSMINFAVGMSCDDGNDRTTRDTINEDCECVGIADLDMDGIPNNEDNCMAIFNPDQNDNDNDGAGDLCDEDDDNDGVIDSLDCSPLDPDESIEMGSACDDGNSNTDNDIIVENCMCEGTPIVQTNLRVDTAVITFGDTACVDIRVMDFTDIHRFNLSLQYDTNLVSLLSIEADSLLDQAVQSQMDTSGVNISWGATDTFVSLADQSTLATLCFTALVDSNYQSVIAWDSSETFVQNIDSFSTLGALSDGLIQVSEIFIDSDNDGIRDSEDCAPMDSTLAERIGDSCNDGNDFTVGDTIGVNCICEGIVDSTLLALDQDRDNVLDSIDNCVGVANPGQRDYDNDGIGDACDIDADGDGVENRLDCNPLDSLGRDTIGSFCDDGLLVTVDDTIGRNCVCAGVLDSTLLALDMDRDNVIDSIDNCPMVANEDQSDYDGDSIGDACDMDADGDGVLNTVDCMPLDSLQSDSIGIACDDSINVTINDRIIAGCVCAGVVDSNLLAFDQDMDNIPDSIDNCVMTMNPDQLDADGDGIGDLCDPDDDNDGVADHIDCAPLDSSVIDSVGMPCDDMNPMTTSDTLNADCECVGTPPARLALEIDTMRIQSGETECIDVISYGFDSISSAQFSIRLASNIGTITEVNNRNLTTIGRYSTLNSKVEIDGDSLDVFCVQWSANRVDNMDDNSFLTLQDSTALFEVCVNILTDTVLTTQIIVDSSLKPVQVLQVDGDTLDVTVPPGVIIVDTVDEAAAQIMGNIRTPNEEPIPQVTVDAKGLNVIEKTNIDGFYAVRRKSGASNVEIVPYMENDLINGVDMTDFVMLRRHILGYVTLPSNGYVYAAADINGDSVLDSMDLIEIRNLILGLADDDAEHWRFVPTAYDFGEIPIFTFEGDVFNYPRSYQVTPNMQGEGMDFVGVKVGDLNGTVDIDLFKSRSSEPVLPTAALNITNQYVEAGEAFSIALHSAEDYEGLSLALEYDADALEAKESAASQIVDQGVLGIVHYKAVEAPESLELRFVAKRGGYIADWIDLNTAAVKPKLVTRTGEDRQPILRFVKGDLNSAQGLWLKRIAPNPFTTQSQLIVGSDREGESLLRIFNSTGQMVAQQKVQLSKGENAIPLYSEILGQSGLYYFHLLQGNDLVKGKILLLD